jgi:imidazole glycerol-phosphate synthase subunit HisH
MPTPVGVIDYGAGNIESIRGALTRIGVDCRIVRTPEELVEADRLVLPGVGASGEAAKFLRAHGLDMALEDSVRRRGTPLLAICVGMQLLARRLHEFGEHEGLGWIDAEVRKIVPDAATRLRVPHMGWNAVATLEKGRPFFGGLRPDRAFYFAHSYALRWTGDSSALAATAEYGTTIAAAVQFGSVLGVQFHPEKSQINGERLIAAFCDWRP